MPFLAHAVAHCATCRAAKTGTDSRAVLATQRTADHRTTGSANATADSRLGAVTLVRTGCATGRTRDTGTDGRASAAAELLSNHVAQRTTQATAQRCGAIAGRHCTLSNQKAQNQSRQS